jgi:hypothetical protein
MFKINLLPFLLLLVIVLNGCRKFATVSNPEWITTKDKVFSSDSSAAAAMNTVYTLIAKQPNIINGNNTKLPGLYSDELYRQSVYALDTGFISRNLDPDYRPLIAVWKDPYDFIVACNGVIEGLKNTDRISAGVKERLTGEAKFMRALSYFSLLRLFGGVPLVTGTDYQKNEVQPRSSATTIETLIISDLNDAALLLPDNFTGMDSMPYRRIKPSRWAALALLARVQLYRQNWSEAERLASEVINSGLFHLAPTSETFKAASPETLFQLQSVGTANAAEAGFFINPPAVRPIYEASPTLLASFEKDDARKTSWLREVKVGGQTYYGIHKYKVVTGVPHKEYLVILRLGEQYLIRAEARARQQKTAGALEDLDLLRQRATLSPLSPALSGVELLLAIAQERQVELFAEAGHRFFDLQRWAISGNPNDPLNKMAVTVFAAKAGWEIWKLLWPIPADELRLNSRLHQNPGYN